MSQGTLFFQPIQHAFAAAQVVPNAKAYFYLAGTTTAVSVYSDVLLTTAYTQPVVADANGVFAEIFLTPGTAYKVDLQTSAGVSLTGYPADNQLAIPASASTVDTTETAGEALTAGQAAYLSDGSGGKNAGQLYKADSANTYSSTLPTIGMVPSAIAAGATGSFRQAGLISGLTSLTPGSYYFVGTAGALTTTAPTNARRIGQADSATTLIINANASIWATLTPNAIVLATGAASLGTTAALTNGQLAIGNTGNAPSLATLTAGAGVQVTNAAGAITIANGVLDRKTTTTTIASSAAESTLYSFAVPGGTLSTNRVLHFSGTGTIIQNTGVADKSFIFKLKYGSRTVANITILNMPTANASGPLTIDGEIMAAGATNAQVSKCLISIGYSAADFNVGGLSQANIAGAWYAELITVNAADVGGTVDSTASQNLVLTVTMSASSASLVTSLNAAYTEVK